VPSLFKRKDAEPPAVTDEPEAVGDDPRPKGYTPKKGKETPKRRDTTRRRPGEPAPTNRKEAVRRAREVARAERVERREAMMAGDERYLMARDRGPERALVRDIVDSRMTVGTWFFGGALLVLLGSSQLMPLAVRSASNILWALLALGTVIDSILISLRVRKLVRQRFPKTTQRMGGLYLYAAMRGLTFRRMRVPRPRVRLGAPV
jgi:hypothetical protein